MNLRPIASIYRRLPVWLKKNLIKLYKYLPNSHCVVVAEIDGIKYELDLDRFIDASIFYYGSHEPETTAFIKQYVKPGMIVFDIGANTGGHTLRFADIVGTEGKVYAFEPMSEAFTRLERNISLNNFKNIITENIGLSNVDHVEEIYFTFYGPMDGVQPVHTKEAIRFIRLDDYVEQEGIQRVDFIKIDVDGYEYKVLTGAEQLLRKNMPIMIVEVGFGYQERFGETLDGLLGFLWSLGYVFYSEELELLKSKKEVLQHLPEKGATNVICMEG